MLFAAALATALTLVAHPCADKSTEFRCGTITVPENAEIPGGRTIGLNVVIVPAKNHRDGAAPLLVLDGGPGIAATNAAPFYLGPGAFYRQDRDVVLFDQRGTGRSNALRCPALEHRSPLKVMYPRNDVRACRDDLQKRTDLSQYSTEIAAGDIDRVREALGYTAIDIWSISYGTRLAQEYIKRYPQRVRHAVLVGFVPLDYRTPLFHATNGQRVLDLLFHECQSDEACRTRYPDLRSEWQSVVRSFGKRRGPFMEAVRSLLGTAAAQRQLPSLIHAAAHGDRQPFIDRFPRDSSTFAEGLYLTIACSEGASRIDPAEISKATKGTFLGDYRVREELGACAEWPRYRLREGFFDPPKTSPPILVISGEMDHVAVPEWGYRFCSTVPQCRFVSIPQMGHGPFDLDAWTNGMCFDRIADSFYRDALDDTCVKSMRPPAFK